MAIPSTEVSADVRALAEALKATPVGNIITHADLSSAIGRDIKKVRFLIPRAMREANRESGAIFGTVRGEGYKRLPPSEAHSLGQTTRSLIRRRAARTIRTITTTVAKANDLSNSDRLRATAEVAALGLIQHMARDSSLPQPEAPNKPVPVAVAAKQFLERIGAVQQGSEG